jgi:predicted nucleic acid-binding protein
VKARAARPTLVDTSVWVELLRATGSPVHRALNEALESGRPLWLTGVVLQEVLQGARSAAQADDLRRLLAACVVLAPVFPETYEHAATLYGRCRRAGRAVRGTVDCLVAAVALEHGLAVLGVDRDLRTLRDVRGRAPSTSKVWQRLESRRQLFCLSQTTRDALFPLLFPGPRRAFHHEGVDLLDPYKL